jgi:AcrR family transcriptional regulator
MMSNVAVMPRGDAVAEVGIMVQTDGRNRRAAETRRKIIAAAKAMIDETSVAPTVVGVARRADVSVRSVFQHFKDVQSLFVTVVDSVSRELAIPPTTPDSQPLDVRVQSVVQNLAQVYDKIVPLRVAAGQFVGHPALMARSMALRQALRDGAFKVFATEFGGLDDAAREQLADAIGAALSLEAWTVLRRRDGLSVERATAAWQLTLTALLDHALAGAK